MTSGILLENRRIANRAPAPAQSDQSDFASKERPRAAIANMELYPREWYVELVGRGPKRPNLSMAVLWEGIGLMQDGEEKKAMREKADSLVGLEILRLNLKDKKRHPEIKEAITIMDKTYRSTILRRRQHCTDVFRECLWYKLILSCRNNRIRSSRDDSDATWVDEDLYEATTIDSAELSSSKTPREKVRRYNDQDLHLHADEGPQTTRDIGRRPFRSATPEPPDGVNPTQPHKTFRSNPPEKVNTIDGLSETIEVGNLNARATRSNPKNASKDRAFLPRLLSPKPDRPRCAIRQGNSVLGAASRQDDMSRPFKRPVQEDKLAESPKKQKTTPTHAKSPSNSFFSPTVPSDDNCIEIDSDSSTRPFLQDLDDVPLVTRPKNGARPGNIFPERQDQRDLPESPRTRRISVSSSPRLIPNFKLAKTQPHGKVRVGYIRDGQYSPIHTGKIRIKKIQEIFDVFRNSTGSILTAMQMWLRDTSYIDGLGIQSVTLPPKGPYPQLYEFFGQAALRERSKIGLDFVVEPVGLEDYFE